MAPEQYYAPYAYGYNGYMQTPPYYPYYTPSPWGMHYPAASPYGHQHFQGFATGSPAANTTPFYQAYPTPIEYNGQSYPQEQSYPSYGYVPQAQMVEAVPEEHSQAQAQPSENQDNSPPEQHDSNAQ
jgi:hypothetical protein